MKAYKRFILSVIIAFIGILTPCVVSVELSYSQEIFVDERAVYAVEADDKKVSEVAATMLAENIGQKEKRTTVKAVKKKKPHASVMVLREKRHTYQFYGREAGGIPAETTFLLAS